MMKGDAPPLSHGFVLEAMTHHVVPWWLTTEDLPDPNNRVTLHNTTPLSVESAQPGLLGFIRPATPAERSGHATTDVPLHAYSRRASLERVGHQNGTCRMVSDPATSMLNPQCKAHGLNNLYVVNASCFVSASAVNPSLTIIANSLRIADHPLPRVFGQPASAARKTQHFFG